MDDLAEGFGKELKNSRSNGRACRELLDEIRRTTFLLEDNHNLMEELREHLTTLQAELFNSVPRECGIPLRRVKTRKAMTKVKSEQFLTLCRRKRKVKFGGRIGQRKEKIMQAIEINVGKEGNHGDIETEIITTEGIKRVAHCLKKSLCPLVMKDAKTANHSPLKRNKIWPSKS